MQLSGDQQVSLWNDARLLYRQVVQLRWLVVDQSGRTIPTPLIVMLIVWLMVIFASFGYQAPRNRVVMSSFVVAALLISAALYLILDMDAPVSGLARTSNVPFQRAAGPVPTLTLSLSAWFDLHGAEANNDPDRL
jgi:hypothetical protein